MPSALHQEIHEYFFRQGKMLIFQKPSLFKDIADELVFIRTESPCRRLASRNLPQFTAKVEMMASSAQHAPLHHIISQRALPCAGRSEQQDRTDGSAALLNSAHGSAGAPISGQLIPKTVAAFPLLFWRRIVTLYPGEKEGPSSTRRRDFRRHRGWRHASIAPNHAPIRITGRMIVCIHASTHRLFSMPDPRSVWHRTHRTCCRLPVRWEGSPPSTPGLFPG